MIKLLITSLLMAVAISASAATFTEDFESYQNGSLAGQGGWYLSSGTSTAVLYADNGPSLAGSRCVHLSNLSGNGIILLHNTTNDSAGFCIRTACIQQTPITTRRADSSKRGK